MKQYPWVKPVTVTLAWAIFSVPASLLSVSGERQLAQRLHEDAHPWAAVFSAAVSVAAWMSALYAGYYLSRQAGRVCASKSEQLPPKVGFAHDLERGLVTPSSEDALAVSHYARDRLQQRPWLSPGQKSALAVFALVVNATAAALTQVEIKDWVHQADNPGHFIFNNGLYELISAVLYLMPLTVLAGCYAAFKNQGVDRTDNWSDAASSVDSVRTVGSDSGYGGDTGGGKPVMLYPVSDDGHVSDAAIYALQLSPRR